MCTACASPSLSRGPLWPWPRLLTPRPPARVAVARKGGAVELVNPQDCWVVLGAVPGVRGRKMDALACGGRAPPAATVAGAPPPPRRADERRRLFGCSRDGTLFELDFAARR